MDNFSPRGPGEVVIKSGDMEVASKQKQGGLKQHEN